MTKRSGPAYDARGTAIKYCQEFWCGSTTTNKCPLPATRLAPPPRPPRTPPPRPPPCPTQPRSRWLICASTHTPKESQSRALHPVTYLACAISLNLTRLCPSTSETRRGTTKIVSLSSSYRVPVTMSNDPSVRVEQPDAIDLVSTGSFLVVTLHHHLAYISLFFQIPHYLVGLLSQAGRLPTPNATHPLTLPEKSLCLAWALPNLLSNQPPRLLVQAVHPTLSSATTRRRNCQGRHPCPRNNPLTLPKQVGSISCAIEIPVTLPWI